nr:putative cytochrome P450 [Tanacetum cinerariifolium]
MVDMISNRVFKAALDVDSIIDKIREGRLRWFGHVKRRPQSALVRRVETMVVEGSKRRGRPKLRWEDRLKMDMKELRLSEDMTCDRNAWRDRIRISRPLCLSLLVGSGFVSCSSIEHLLYAHVHWPEVPSKQSLYFQVYLGGRGRICLHFTSPIPRSGGIGYVVVVVVVDFQVYFTFHKNAKSLRCIQN